MSSSTAARTGSQIDGINVNFQQGRAGSTGPPVVTPFFGVTLPSRVPRLWDLLYGHECSKLLCSVVWFERSSGGVRTIISILLSSCRGSWATQQDLGRVEVRHINISPPQVFWRAPALECQFSLSWLGLSCNRTRDPFPTVLPHCLKSKLLLEPQRAAVKPEHGRKVGEFLCTKAGPWAAFPRGEAVPGELWKNQLWNQWNPRPGKHQSVIHYPLVSELLCWQKLFLMTITSPQPLTHTGLHYRKHGATESQFLQAATGLGFIPSCHYLPTSLQELLPCQPISVLVSCFNLGCTCSSRSRWGSVLWITRLGQNALEEFSQVCLAPILCFSSHLSVIWLKFEGSVGQFFLSLI